VFLQLGGHSAGWAVDLLANAKYANRSGKCASLEFS
jgi:hypothetical protein